MELSEKEETLLRASLMSGRKALVAWQKYGATIDRDTIDNNSQRILPLLYSNLKQLHINTPTVSFLSGVHKNTWLRNEIVFRTAKPILKELHRAGIRAMLMDGMILAKKYYSDQALRSIGTFSFLVPTCKVYNAVNTLERNHFLPKGDMSFLDNNYILVNRSCKFYNDAGVEIEMCWHIFEEHTGFNDDDTFWDNSIPFEFDDISSFSLNPTDQLLYICINGIKNESTSAIVWVADALTILKGSKIDWNFLLQRAEEKSFILPMVETLEYLKNTFAPTIPLFAIDSLRSMPINKIEYAELKTRKNTNSILYPIYYHLSQFGRYLKSKNEHYTFFDKIVESLTYFKYVWNLQYLWQVPYVLFIKSIKKILMFVPAFRQNNLKK